MQLIDAIPPLPPRPQHGHKGLFGRVLVVGGSPTMLGAPLLAGTAALRAGAGWVQIAVPGAILPAALSVTPELVGLPLDDEGDAEPLLAAAELADALVIGPGLGTGKPARAHLQALLRLEKPAVLDADALNLLAGKSHWPKKLALRAVLTPHPGEMKRLAPLIGRDDVPADDQGRIALAMAAATAFGQVVALKGEKTVVSDGSRVYLNRTGDSSLSKAGTGDVLAGLLGTLLAQMPDAFAAAVLAVHLHGRAGEQAGQRLGRRAVLARDVIDSLGPVMQAHEAAASRPNDRL
jgi:NAD(P)H-hydrate epimerase